MALRSRNRSPNVLVVCEKCRGSFKFDAPSDAVAIDDLVRLGWEPVPTRGKALGHGEWRCPACPTDVGGQVGTGLHTGMFLPDPKK